jgi:superfamily I DNA and/or RNA helicase
VERAPDVFEAAVFEPLLRHAMRRLPQLAAFDGDTHGRLIARFRELEQARLEITRAEVALARYDRLPKRTGISPLERELAEPESDRPLRELLARQGAVIQAIKPVFMMSPLSVPLHLPPGAVRFDLLVIDEASRMEALNALGAIARADQLVVVGDDCQPPPPQLLTGGQSDLAREEGEPVAPRPTRESILDLCAARGMPERGLRWHYRSRHPSLIALSNREFYGGRLCVVPSPFLDTADLGLRFHYVPAGIYDRSASRPNRIEARAVAEAALEHARKRPHLSLGVGCLSAEQRDAVLLALEGLWRSEPETHGFFAADRPEPFFVKSLEHIQGDARDVILASIGYGADESGHLTQSFGALSAEGGERQLNVLMTRARQRLEVFASIRARDIDPVRPDRPGVAALKAFLQSAESNTLGLAQPSGGGYSSIFEEQVAAALSELGY